MSFSSSIARPRMLGAGVALGLAVTLLPAQPAEAAGGRVTPRFFGMTDSSPQSWPATRIGALRLWDSGVTWREIETSPGTFTFATLDAHVRAARAHRARPLLVLGMTPGFHSTSPGTPGLYGDGSTAMPELKPWRRYVKRVVARYGAKMDYQVWNEANVSGFWSGTPAQMAKLTKITSKIVNRKAPRAKVVSPALATRLTGQRKWLRDFYAQRTGGKRVGSWVDVVGLNLYPLPNAGPEGSARLLAASRIMLGAAGVGKPIWNTEVNYGLQTGGGGLARNISGAKEASFVARTLVLNAADRVKRVFWYSWSIGPLANTQLTQEDGVTRTRAGRAFGTVRGWMVRSRMQGCSRDGAGTYTCTLRKGKSVKRIYWNPSRRASVQAVDSATRKVALSGQVTSLSGGERLRVTKMPILVRSGR